MRRSRSPSPAGGGLPRRSKRLAGAAPEIHDHVFLTLDADADSSVAIGKTYAVRDAMRALGFGFGRIPQDDGEVTARWKLHQVAPDDVIAELQAACDKANVKLHVSHGHALL